MGRESSRKGAIDLSISFIVIIIIAVILLTLGVTWLRGMFGQITDLSAQQFSNAHNELTKAFQDPNSNVDFSIFPMDIKSNPGVINGIAAAIKNDDRLGGNHKFVINVVPLGADTNIKTQYGCSTTTAAFSRSSCQMLYDEMARWLTFPDAQINIQINQYNTNIDTRVTVPSNAVKGVYQFAVVACYDGGQNPITSSSNCQVDNANWGGSAQIFTITVQ